MIRMLAADNHPIALRGLKEIMAEGFPGSVVDETSSGREAVSRIEHGRYDVALIDLSLSDLNGFEVLRQVRKTKPDLPVLLWSSNPGDHCPAEMPDFGASRYVPRRSTSEELVQAVERVLSGEQLGDYPVASAPLNMELDAVSCDDRSKLELQVARMIADGKTTKEIAGELGLSVNTVRTYRERIFRKIGVKGTNRLVRYMIKNGLARQEGYK